MTGRPRERTTPAVRPYVITRGRAGTGGAPLPWETLVTAADVPLPDSLLPEHLLILRECRGLLSVAEIAAYLGQPPPVTQILLADLVHWGLVVLRPPVPPADRTDATMLRKVLHGLERRL
ncbi:DUF742 domain-containing protein [Streptomyces sp. NPDC006798]|uniref:DUF742 domain-containing protein n=1 Tax=unclassified Streptomyces TaxID=2593676 RepID=UPI0033D9C51E